MNIQSPLHLFQGFGVELEYMIVSKGSLDVLPVCDQILKAVNGAYVAEVEVGELAWSNELVLHVIELKTNGPAAALESLPALFQSQVGKINEMLAPHNGFLLPGAMHPWMNPERETKLWNHEHNDIYDAYNRIFDCRGHGWSNLQSTHLNLPFANDQEFGKLHAAVRLLLPILPALAASSPLVDGQRTGFLDNRMAFYRSNQKIMPEIAGKIIPEPVYSRTEYETLILDKMYRKIAKHDPEAILQHEWLNSRGAIARFDRNAIEIRVIDVQECPLADLAILAAAVSVLKALVNERWSMSSTQKRWGVETLSEILWNTVNDGEKAVIYDSGYLELFSYPGSLCTAGELWQYLVEILFPGGSDSIWREPLDFILDNGTLARRINSAAGDEPSAGLLKEIYQELADCLQAGRMFIYED